MINKYLTDREINVGNNLNSSYFSNKIIKTYYETSEQLYKHKIDLPESHFPTRINFLNFSQDGNYMATASYDNLLFWNLNCSYSVAKSKKMKKDFDGIILRCILNEDSSKIIYGGNNYTKKNYNLHINDTATGEIIKKVCTNSMIRDLSLNPMNSNIVSFANRNKKLFSYDLRNSNLNEIKVFNLKVKPIFCSLQYHPTQENLILVTTNSEDEVFTFDVRNGQIISKYEIPYYKKNISYHAYYNRRGTQILVAKSNVGPILFNSEESKPIYEFDEFGYYSPTIGHYCCFAGIEDEYIASCSENFNVYMWKIPEIINEKNDEILLKKVDKSKFILKGHSFEINGVNYNYSKSYLASFGDDEKLIFWSPFSLYSKSEDIESNFSNDTSHERNLIYDNSDIINADSLLIRRLFIEYMFFFPSYNQFCYYLKKVLNMKTQLMEKCFKENLSIQFIHSFIIQYKIRNNLVSSRLLEKFKKDLEENFENNLSLHMQYLSILYETKKVFETKFVVMNSIDFLKLHIKLSKKTKKKLIFLIKNKPTADRLERLKSLKKITLIMKVMLYDLFTIFNLSKELYEISFQLMKKLLARFFISDNFDSLGFRFSEKKLLKSIYRENYSLNNDEIIDENLFFNQNRNIINYDFYNYYNDNFLFKVSNDSNFKQNFKKKFEALR